MPRQRSHDHRGSEHRRAEQQEIDCIYSSPADSNAKTGCVACSAQSAVSHSWLRSVAKGLVAAYLTYVGARLNERQILSHLAIDTHISSPRETCGWTPSTGCPEHAQILERR